MVKQSVRQKETKQDERTMTKIGRNQPCPCGSGKKHKKCCLNKSKPVPTSTPQKDKLSILMKKGWSLVQNQEVGKGCDIWLELWEKLKPRFKPEFRAVKEADTVFSGSDLICNWCQDLEMELGNAGSSSQIYYHKRIKYCNEFCLLFPDSSKLIIQNMRRAVAESYFALGNNLEGEKCFKGLIAQYPESIWGYIGWGDMYLWPLHASASPDYDRAEEIFSLASGKGLEGEEDLIDRLNEVKKEREKNTKNP